MTAVKTLITADELLAMPADGNHYELIEGELFPIAPTGGEHGVTAGNLTIPLGYYVKEKDLGVICVAETGFRINSDPDTVRAPDIAFISKARIPESGIPKGFWSLAPDLAVEVISPSDKYSDVEDKIEQWLNAGTKLVIIINPRTHRISLHRSATSIMGLTENDQLEFEDIVPGFSYPVAKLFI